MTKTPKHSTQHHCMSEAGRSVISEKRYRGTIWMTSVLKITKSVKAELVVRTLVLSTPQYHPEVASVGSSASQGCDLCPACFPVSAAA